MPYLALLRHQWLRRVRAPRPRLFWLAVLLGSLLLIYGFIGTIFLGLGAEIIVHQQRPGLDPSSVVNSLLAPAALVLLVLRFLFQRPPLRDLTPYLSLPIARPKLARFALLNTSLSLHNVFPLCFAVAFAAQTLAPQWGLTGAMLWVGGVVALLVGLDLLNVYLRAVMGAHIGRFLVIAGTLGGLLALDAWRGPQLATLLSWSYFTALTTGNALLLLGSSLVLWALGMALTKYLTNRLLVQARRSKGYSPELSFSPTTPIWNLLRLELALILRHKRPRQFVLISLIFSTVYTVFVLRTGTPNLMIAVLLGFMSSGMFALNYGPLMFGWESAYFDGILSRPTSLSHLILSKLVLLQISCAVLFLVALPFFLLWAPAFLSVHLAMLVYNAGVCVPFVLFLALGNREPIVLQRSSMFNYQGVSFKHMAWSLVLAVPPVLLALFAPSRLVVVVFVLGLLGVGLSLLGVPMIAQRLSSARYEMARAFRSTVS